MMSYTEVHPKQEDHEQQTTQDSYAEAERITESGSVQISEETTRDIQDVSRGQTNSEGGCSKIGNASRQTSEECCTTKILDVPSHVSIYGASSSDGNKYKSIISPHSLKPLGITFRKPKLDSPSENRRSCGELRAESSRLSSINISLSSMSDTTHNPIMSTTNMDCSDSTVRLPGSDCCTNETDRYESSTINIEIDREEENISDKDLDNEQDQDVDEICHEQGDGENVVCSISENCIVNNEQVDNDITNRLAEQSIGDSLLNNVGSIHTCSSNKLNLLNDSGDLIPVKQQLTESKLNSLSKVLQECPESVDMKLSLFVAACSHDPNTLRPFPHKIFEDNEANRNLVYYLAEEIPCVNMLQYFLKDKQSEPLRKELLPLVDWLIRSEQPRLELIEERQYKNILDNISETNKKLYPSKMFRIKIKRNIEPEESWTNIVGDNETRFAYHRGKVQQTHDLLNHGLHNQLTKNGSLGPGIYLTTDLNACLGASPSSRTWGKSSIATKVQLLYITEFVSNHNVMIYDGQGSPFIITQDNKYKFYFLSKPKLVRLRYLLVYINEASLIPNKPLPRATQQTFLKYLKILRVALLVATIFMGFAASKRSSSKSISILDSLQSYYSKVSEDMQNWSIWQYIETPYITVPLSASMPNKVSSP